MRKGTITLTMKKGGARVEEFDEEELRFVGERQEITLRMRTTLNAERRVHTMDEVAAVLNVTRERVRQIQNAGLRKIRERREAEAAGG